MRAATVPASHEGNEDLFCSDRPLVGVLSASMPKRALFLRLGWME
jgi:hypothetical protein